LRTSEKVQTSNFKKAQNSKSQAIRLRLIDALLAKPFSAQQLRDAIRAAFSHG
jgi:hypothetical protein